MTNECGTSIFTAISVDADQNDADTSIAEEEDARKRLAGLKELP